MPREKRSKAIHRNALASQAKLLAVVHLHTRSLPLTSSQKFIQESYRRLSSCRMTAFTRLRSLRSDRARLLGVIKWSTYEKSINYLIINHRFVLVSSVPI